MRKLVEMVLRYTLQVSKYVYVCMNIHTYVAYHVVVSVLVCGLCSVCINFKITLYQLYYQSPDLGLI